MPIGRSRWDTREQVIRPLRADAPERSLMSLSSGCICQPTTRGGLALRQAVHRNLEHDPRVRAEVPLQPLLEPDAVVAVDPSGELGVRALAGRGPLLDVRVELGRELLSPHERARRVPARVSRERGGDGADRIRIGRTADQSERADQLPGDADRVPGKAVAEHPVRTIQRRPQGQRQDDVARIPVIAATVKQRLQHAVLARGRSPGAPQVLEQPPRIGKPLERRPVAAHRAELRMEPEGLRSSNELRVERMPGSVQWRSP